MKVEEDERTKSSLASGFPGSASAQREKVRPTGVRPKEVNQAGSNALAGFPGADVFPAGTHPEDAGQAPCCERTPVSDTKADVTARASRSYANLS